MAAGAFQPRRSVCSGGAAIPGYMTWGLMADHVSSTKLHGQAAGLILFPPAGLFLSPKAVQVVRAVFRYKRLWHLSLSNSFVAEDTTGNEGHNLF